MAKKKSSRTRSRKKKRGGLITMLWLAITSLFGGGVGGYYNPHWPVVGPMLQNFRTQLATEGSEKIREALHLPQQAGGTAPSAVGTAPVSSGGQAQFASATRPADKLLLASFNIQVFGTSKMAKPDVMSIIVHIIKQFDLVAIQEVRAQDDTILPQLVAMLNADGSRYHFVIGPRQGRTVSTEQYAFVYDTNRVEYDPQSIGVMGDPQDLLHREPFVTRFRARTSAPDRAFSFWLVNIHTDPDEVPTEVDALADAFTAMQSANPSEDDVILLGDLNASAAQMGRLGQIPGIHCIVGSQYMTNTRRSKAYDNIIVHAPSTGEFTGRWGVYNFQTQYRLSQEQALKISDHFPVWAEFHIWEAPQRGLVADRNPRQPR